MNPQAWADLLTAAAGVPRLTGAKCYARPEVFDLDSGSAPELIERAKHECRGCSAVTACGDWLDGLAPSARPSGVVAGRLIAQAASADPAPKVDAVQWLVDFLTHGPTEARKVTAAAAVVGIGRSKLAAARQAAGVVFTRPTRGRPSMWFPPPAAPLRDETPLPGVGTPEQRQRIAGGEAVVAS